MSIYTDMLEYNATNKETIYHSGSTVDEFNQVKTQTITKNVTLTYYGDKTSADKLCDFVTTLYGEINIYVKGESGSVVIKDEYGNTIKNTGGTIARFTPFKKYSVYFRSYSGNVGSTITKNVDITFEYVIVENPNVIKAF